MGVGSMDFVGGLKFPKICSCWWLCARFNSRVFRLLGSAKYENFRLRIIIILGLFPFIWSSTHINGERTAGALCLWRYRGFKRTG